jgi:hypothetical protein
MSEKDIQLDTTPYISYDNEEKKPLVLNEAASMELVNIIKGHKRTLDFSVDEAFLKYYEKETGKQNPTQQEINIHIESLVRSCPRLEEKTSE